MTFSNVKQCEIEPYFPMPEGKVRIGVETTIEGTSNAEVPVNPFYATLVTESGASYESSLAGCKPALRAVRVTKGTTASGWISFEIPQNLAGLKMIYRPVVIGGGVEEVRFDLGPSPGR
jgi:hypothetical protein